MLVTWDFETEAIQPLPDYPPKPVGLALLVDNRPHYYSFGHPTGNNCTESEARAVLSKFWFNPDVELVAHNNSFDMAVAVKHWLLPLKRNGIVHDTLVMAFLCDPHALTYALKPLAEKLLDMPPEEADAVRAWCITNGFLKRNAKEYGAYICKAPGGLVGTYAIGDVVRTEKLFRHYMEKLNESGMLDAYRREIAVQIIMLKNTLDGISVDADALACDVGMYDAAMLKIDGLIFKLLGCQPFNIDSDAQLALAIDKANPELSWSLTKTGKKSTSKANMEKTLEGLTGTLLAAMQYRASVKTCVNTFMRPWLVQAACRRSDGRIRCQWNTTRGDDGGSRTGRLSSTPSLMNIPTLSSAKFSEVLKLWGTHLKCMGYPPLPNVRSYIIPDDGHELVSFDYSAQELRVLAHYENDVMLRAYQDNPAQDLHQYAADLISSQIGKSFKRKQAKTCAFAIIYGAGISTLAVQLGSTFDEASEIKRAYLAALPGVDKLIASLKSRADRCLPIRTWGQRVYFVEPPRIVEGRWRNYAYKLLNYLCQGSSADITKEAIIEYDRSKENGRLILTVHDQIVISVPKEHWLTESIILKRCMESVQLDAKLLADGSHGANLHDVEDFVC